MDGLIKITKSNIDGADVNSVNAREIYNFLGVKSRFNDWIKNRLSDFLIGEDYIIVTKNLVTEANDIFVTLDTAKHISMLERNEKGREARQYFIDVEKKTTQLLIPQNPMEALELFFNVSKEQESRIVKLEQTKRLENWQERTLTDEKNKIVYGIAGDDKSFATKLHRKVWSLFKKRFKLARYNELPSIMFEDGVDYIRNLTLADMV